MNKKMLTPEQYVRTNKTMVMILTLCYIVYDIIDIKKLLSTTGTETFGLIRVILYMALTIAMWIVVRKKADKKSTMLFLGISFTLMYMLFVFGNGVGAMVLVFPAVIGFTIYLNSLLLILGFVFALLICAIKALSYKFIGDIVMFELAGVVTITLVICIVGTWRAINLLIAFSKEDQEVIQEEAFG